MCIRDRRNAAQTVQNVVTYDAVLDVQNDKLELKPGMTANVTFVSQERDDVLRVPNAALRFRPPPEMFAGRGTGDGGVPPKREGSMRRGDDSPSDQKTVWVLKDGQPKPVKVKVGISDGSVTELVEGELEDGAAVITEATVPGAKKAAAGGASPLGGAQGGGQRRMF